MLYVILNVQVPRDADSSAGVRGRGGARALRRHAVARAALGRRAPRLRLAAPVSAEEQGEGFLLL